MLSRSATCALQRVGWAGASPSQNREWVRALLLATRMMTKALRHHPCLWIGRGTTGNRCILLQERETSSVPAREDLCGRRARGCGRRSFAAAEPRRGRRFDKTVPLNENIAGDEVGRI